MRNEIEISCKIAFITARKDVFIIIIVFLKLLIEKQNNRNSFACNLVKSVSMQHRLKVVKTIVF